MSYYFVEIDVDTDKIIRWHDSTSLGLAMKDSKGLMIQVNEEQYRMVSACKGNLERGRNVLGILSAKITQAVFEEKETRAYD